MASFDEFISSIIADGNDGKAFELFCKHFLETAPEYKDQFEKVWLWDQWPNHPKIEAEVELFGQSVKILMDPLDVKKAWP